MITIIADTQRDQTALRTSHSHEMNATDVVFFRPRPVFFFSFFLFEPAELEQCLTVTLLPLSSLPRSRL